VESLTQVWVMVNRTLHTKTKDVALIFDQCY